MTVDSFAINPGQLFEALMDHSQRADPYPLYAKMREYPVIEGPGLFAVTRHRDLHALLRDPRISSDARKAAGRSAIWTDETPEGRDIGEPPFIFLDPPDHTRIRSLVVKDFRPRIIERLRQRILDVTNELLDAVADHKQFDLVADLAMPLPVTIICELLGIPHEDVSRFQGWTRKTAHALDPGPTMTEEERVEVAVAVFDLFNYCRELADSRRVNPRDDYLTALVKAEEGGDTLSEHSLLTSIGLLLVTGHETTVNLLANSMLALFRHPETFERLKADSNLASNVVEETLRYDPPVQFRNRVCLENVTIDGSTIPAGANVALLLASGNRDPEKYPNPDRFDIDREFTGHLGFGAGPHFCMGAPLARLQAQLALSVVAGRLHSPQLVADPPPYRPNVALRGPERLDVAVTRILPATAG